MSNLDESTANTMGWAEISVQELKRRLDGGEALVVLDVREPVERDFCAIPVPPTARDLHIPMNALPGRLEEIREACRSSPLVVYCHHGVRSRQVTAWLSHSGIPGVANLEGGIDDWSVDVDPGVPRY